MGLAEGHALPHSEKIQVERGCVEQRRRPRFPHRGQFMVLINEGEWLPCVSRDVSASGLFIHIGRPTQNKVAPGERIVLSMPLKNQDAITFHCKVAYITPEGMGLDASENEGALGHAITLSLFYNISNRYSGGHN